MGGERELFAHHRSYVDRRGPLGQRVEIRIVGGFRVGAEHRSVHLDFHFVDDFGETAPAGASNHSMEITSPEVFSIAGYL